MRMMRSVLSRLVPLLVVILGMLAPVGSTPAHAAVLTDGGGCDQGYPALSACVSEDSNHAIIPDAWAYGPGPSTGCRMEIDLYVDGGWWTGLTGLPCQGHFSGYAHTALSGNHTYQAQ